MNRNGRVVRAALDTSIRMGAAPVPRHTSRDAANRRSAARRHRTAPAGILGTIKRGYTAMIIGLLAPPPPPLGRVSCFAGWTHERPAPEVAFTVIPRAIASSVDALDLALCQPMWVRADVKPNSGSRAYDSGGGGGMAFHSASGNGSYRVLGIRSGLHSRRPHRSLW